MLKAIQRFLIVSLLLVVVGYLGYQALLYYLSRDEMPRGMVIANVDVSEMTRADAGAALLQAYTAPIVIVHRQEQIPVNPLDVGFSIDIDTMLNEAEAIRDAKSFWEGYVEYLLNRPLEPKAVRLIAAHDREALAGQLQRIADYLDKPATAPQLLTGAGSYQEGEPGYVTDVEASLPLAEMALYQPDPADREVELVIKDQAAIPFNIDVLAAELQRKISADEAEGMFGSVFVLDLETGEEVGINSDVAISGLSILKIAIFVEAYRALDTPPDAYTQQLFYNTAALSSNNNANLLLHIVAGEENTYEGAAVLTESMHHLGLVNTFMAIPYDAIEVSTRPSTYTTPANSRTDSPIVADTAMQTTAEDIGTLLSMVYYCAKDGGGLAAAYPGDITPDECQAILDLMAQNDEGNLIRFGTPEGTKVSHKHGWDLVTHGDAGVVISPGGDYVLVMYLSDLNNTWLSYEISFPLMQEMSQIVYNYFNFDDPYIEDVRVRAEREAAARAAAAAAAEESSEDVGTEAPVEDALPDSGG